MTSFLRLLIIVLTGFSIQSNAQITLSAFASGFNDPVDIKNCGDDRLFVVEQRGYIQIVDTNGVKRSTPFLNIQTRTKYGSEQGLLGLAFAPDYKESGYFYVYYTYQTRGDVRISRFRVSATNPDSADANSEEILMNIWQPYSNHNGGHLAFGPDGYLYIGTGDGGSGGDPGNRAQNRDTLLGKMLRIKVAPGTAGYQIPGDNAFVCSGQSGAPEIWAYGLRNPWRWSFDRMTGDLWIGDVGQSALEEIDFQPAGQGRGWNYGWRCYESTNSYDQSIGCSPPISNYVFPAVSITRAGGRCSVTGGYVYRGGRYNVMHGKYFYTDYCAPSMFTVVPDGSGGFINTALGNLGGSSFSTFGEDRWGELYVASLGGTIYKFGSADCIPAAALNGGRDTISDCGNGQVLLKAPPGKGYSYNWSLNGTALIGDSSTYLATQSGTYTVQVNSTNGCTNSASIVYQQQAPIQVSFQGLDTLYCVTANAVNLQPSHLGGYFEGSGMTCAGFDPGLAGLGTHTISYTYKTPDGCVYTTTQLVRVDACLGLESNKFNGSVALFPNPGSGNFTLDVVSLSQQKVNLEIRSLPGQLLYSRSLELNNGTNTFRLDLGNYAEGFYLLKLHSEAGSYSQKVVIRR